MLSPMRSVHVDYSKLLPGSKQGRLQHLPGPLQMARWRCMGTSDGGTGVCGSACRQACRGLAKARYAPCLILCGYRLANATCAILNRRLQAPFCAGCCHRKRDPANPQSSRKALAQRQLSSNSPQET